MWGMCFEWITCSLEHDWKCFKCANEHASHRACTPLRANATVRAHAPSTANAPQREHAPNQYPRSTFLL